MLFRLARGTGLRGLTGIAPVRGKIIRPLLDCTGEEVRAACTALHIDYRIDESNADERYSRNAIRHTLVPDFDRVHPGFMQMPPVPCRICKRMKPICRRRLPNFYRRQEL